HPAPRAAEQVHPVEAEGVADGVQLVHEPLDRPQRPVVGDVRLAASELVVEDDPAAVGQLLERLRVVARRAGAAVQGEQRHATLADAAVPHVPAGDGDAPLVDPHAVDETFTASSSPATPYSPWPGL